MSALYWQNAPALPWVLVLLAAVSVIVLLLYPPQLRHAPRAVQWVVPTLRFIASATLITSILRPVTSRPRTEAERGPVVVLLDHSRSMGVVDSGRSPGQWVGVAAALGRLPALSRDPEYQAVQSDCDRLLTLVDDAARARVERDYAKLSGGAVDAAGARLDQNIRDLRSTAHDAAAKAADFVRGAQLERALAYLVGPPAGTDEEAWLDRIGDKARAAANEAEQARIANDAVLYAADSRVRDACTPLQSMSRLALSLAVATDAGHGLVARLGSDIPMVVFGIGEQVTPIVIDDRSAPATPALLDADAKSTNLVGGIRSALSSLHDTPVRAVVLFSDGRQVNAESPSGLPGNGVPIFTVAAAGHTGFKDISIIDVNAPSSAFAGETVAVRLQVREVGLVDRSTQISLVAGEDRQSRLVTFADDRPVPVEFKWTAKTGGTQRLVIEATGIPGEISLENNRVERWVKIFDRKVRVGIVGTSGKDLEIARHSLLHAAWADLAKASESWTPERIGRLDVFLLSGVDTNFFNAAQWIAVAKLVNEQGGSVIFVPSDSGSFGETNPALAGMLPFTRTVATGRRVWPGAMPGFQIAPAPGIHVLDFGEPGDAVWQTLAPISQYVPITPSKQGTRSLLVETESGAPVLTESRIGRGHVLCFGATETWRWGATSPEYPEQFWRQLLRYADGEQYQAHDGEVSLDTDPVSLEPNQSVRVRAKISGGTRDPESIKIRVSSGTKVVCEQVLTPTPPKAPGIFETTLPGLPEGDYEVQADAGAAPGKPVTRLHVHPSFEAEMTDLSVDEPWLRRLSQSTGGQFLRLDQIDQLPARLRDLPPNSTHPVESALWDGPYLFMLVLGCLTAEWGLRKRFGLA